MKDRSTGIGMCDACPHRTYDLDKGVRFCPCEGCHYGGHIIGREVRENKGSNEQQGQSKAARRSNR